MLNKLYCQDYFIFMQDGYSFLAQLGILGRVQFTRDQKMLLRAAFDRNSYPSKDEKESVANSIGCTLKKVNDWFMDERRRRRKHQ